MIRTHWNFIEPVGSACFCTPSCTGLVSACVELSEDVVESSSSRAPKFASKSALSGSMDSMDSMDFIHFKCMVMDGHGWSWHDWWQHHGNIMLIIVAIIMAIIMVICCIGDIVGIQWGCNQPITSHNGGDISPAMRKNHPTPQPCNLNGGKMMIKPCD